MLRVTGKAMRPRYARQLNQYSLIESQVNVLRNGKTAVTQGPGGRASRSGYTVTVFGAPGFVGSALVTKLARHGTITVTPYRDQHYARHLKPMGDNGVVNFQEFDLRNIESIENSVRHSDVVVNLIGRNWETKNFSFEDVHIEGARRIATAAAKFGVPRFIHVSSHSVSKDSPSKFLATKALGEDVVRDIIPDATIVRPGPVYGPEDRFLNAMASRAFWLQANEGREKVRPTHLQDLTTALEKIVYDDRTTGKLYELNGPELYRMSEIHDMVREAIKKDLVKVNLPKAVVKAIATFYQYAAYWQGPLTPDEVERMFVDQVETPGALTYADLGLVTPRLLSEELPHIVHFWRPNTYLLDSPESERRRRREQESFANIAE